MNYYFFFNDFFYLIPEFFFFFVILFLLFFGVFYSNVNIYKYIRLTKPVIFLSIILVFFYIILILNNVDNNSIISYYLLLNNNLTVFFKVYVFILVLFFLFLLYNYVFVFEVFIFEFFILFLFSCFSMLLVIMSFDLIISYLAIEMQSLCFYILAAFNKKQNKSVESGLKYFILGSFSSCVLLLGISFIYGCTGVTNFKDLSILLDLGLNSLVLDYFFFFGLILVNVGFFFKLSVAPFHLWLPDVFDGSLRIVVSIFSILPKMSILFLFYKIYIIILVKIIINWQFIFVFFIILSWIIGLQGGLYTNKINRLIAYSSVNHIGFILLALILNNVEGLLLYLVIYTIILLNIFGALFLFIKRNNKAQLNFLNQFIYVKKSNIILVYCFIISIFSLLGIPPLSGFFGKFFIFLNAVFYNFYFLVLLGLILSTFSCFYYLRLIKIISFNNNKNWIFLDTINKNISYFLSFGLFFNLFFLLLIPFFFSFFKFIYLSSFFYF